MAKIQYMLLKVKHNENQFVYKFDGTYIWMQRDGAWKDQMAYTEKSWDELSKYDGYETVTNQCAAKRFIRKLDPDLLKE